MASWVFGAWIGLLLVVGCVAISILQLRLRQARSRYEAHDTLLRRISDHLGCHVCAIESVLVRVKVGFDDLSGVLSRNGYEDLDAMVSHLDALSHERDQARHEAATLRDRIAIDEENPLQWEAVFATLPKRIKPWIDEAKEALSKLHEIKEERNSLLSCRNAVVAALRLSHPRTQRGGTTQVSILDGRIDVIADRSVPAGRVTFKHHGNDWEPESRRDWTLVLTGLVEELADLTDG